jgi:hypothetical protein
MPGAYVRQVLSLHFPVTCNRISEFPDELPTHKLYNLGILLTVIQLVTQL